MTQLAISALIKLLNWLAAYCASILSTVALFSLNLVSLPYHLINKHEVATDADDY